MIHHAQVLTTENVAIALFLPNMLAFDVLTYHQPVVPTASCSDDLFAIIPEDLRLQVE